MKFYTQPGAPNPDVVHMFAEEVGCTSMLENCLLNLGKNESRSSDFYKINPLGEVPALVMTTGAFLTESIAIVKYLNEKHGGSSVIGNTPEERAETDMWIMRTEQKVLEPIGQAFRNGPMFDFFKDRRQGYMHKELVEPMRATGRAGLLWLESQLADGRQFLCGDRFTLADIRFYCLYMFYTKLDESQARDKVATPSVIAYLDRIHARPSAQAIVSLSKKKGGVFEEEEASQ